jgi:hypothetical protein
MQHCCKCKKIYTIQAHFILTLFIRTIIILAQKAILPIIFNYFCSMKLLTLLFNIYLLVLPCLPCSAMDKCEDETTTCASVQVEDDCCSSEDDGKHEEKKDSCTPFCHCDCCITSFYYQLNSKEKVFAKNYTTQKFALLDEVFISNKINIIWQPPKF